MRKISLAFLTVPDISPVEAIEIAYHANYSHVGFRLFPVLQKEYVYPLITDKRLQKDVLSALKNTGIKIGDIELLRLNAETDVKEFDSFFACAQLLGAQNITVICDDPLLERFTSRFTVLCERAKPFGLYLNLEPMYWTGLRNYDDAIEVLKNASQSNAGLLIDAFHFHRSDTSFDIFNQIDPSILRVFQICDAPAFYKPDKDMIRYEARTARLLPGDGELPLVDLLQYIPESTIISVEIPNLQMLQTYAPVERAKMAFDASKQLLKKVLDKES